MRVLVVRPKVVNGKHYGKGEHVLPVELHDHWYVKALIKDGDFKHLEEPKVEVASEVKEPEEKEVAAPSPQPQKKKGK